MKANPKSYLDFTSKSRSLYKYKETQLLYTVVRWTRNLKLIPFQGSITNLLVTAGITFKIPT